MIDRECEAGCLLPLRRSSSNQTRWRYLYQVKMKQLVIADLSKRCNDTNNRLKEFSALYDVVKNERNKYVNLIQASHQALAEMKEKIKILHNEVFPCSNSGNVIQKSSYNVI